jgi:hypothetical protein
MVTMTIEIKGDLLSRKAYVNTTPVLLTPIGAAAKPEDSSMRGSATLDDGEHEIYWEVRGVGGVPYAVSLTFGSVGEAKPVRQTTPAKVLDDGFGQGRTTVHIGP